jgi:hypothetical protein
LTRFHYLLVDLQQKQKVQRDAISTLFTKARQLTGAKSNCFELLTALRSFRFEADSEAVRAFFFFFFFST